MLRLYACLLLAAGVIAGCGLKGDLYREPKPGKAPMTSTAPTDTEAADTTDDIQ